MSLMLMLLKLSPSLSSPFLKLSTSSLFLAASLLFFALGVTATDWSLTGEQGVIESLTGGQGVIESLTEEQAAMGKLT